jgi:hypothetical protein
VAVCRPGHAGHGLELAGKDKLAGFLSTEIVAAAWEEVIVVYSTDQEVIVSLAVEGVMPIGTFEPIIA